MNGNQRTLHVSMGTYGISVWADTGRDLRDPEPPGKDLRAHPRAENGEDLMRALRELHLIAESWECRPVRHRAYLPATWAGEVSGLLHQGTGDRNSHEVKRWTLDAVTLEHPWATALLFAMENNRSRLAQEGTELAPDARFWTHTARFALSLCARQRYLPSFDRSRRTRKPRWVPVITGMDTKTFRTMARGMPPSARCTDTEDGSPFRRTAHQALLVFLNGAVDATVRAAAGQVMTVPTEKDNPSLHDSWLTSLARTSKNFRAGTGDARPITEFIEDWHASLNPRPNREHRLGFRIEETGPCGEARLHTVLHHLHKEDEDPWDIRWTWNLSPIPTLNPSAVDQHRRSVLAEMLRAARESETIERGMGMGKVTDIRIEARNRKKFDCEETPRLEAQGFQVDLEESRLNTTHATPSAGTPSAGTPSPRAGAADGTPPVPGSNQYRLGNMKAPAGRDMLSSWWAWKMHRDLMDNVPKETLRQAKIIVQHDRVRRMTIEDGRASARVMVNGHQNLRPHINFTNVPGNMRREITQEMGARADTMARMIAGDLQPRVENIYAKQGAQLAPRLGIEANTGCNCGSTEPVCLHAAALHVAITVHIDQNPEALMEMRGADVSQMILNMPNTDGKRVSMRNIRYPFPREQERFWTPPPDCQAFPAIQEPKPPREDGRLMGNLELPPDWDSETDPIEAALPVYREVSRRAAILLEAVGPGRSPWGRSSPPERGRRGRRNADPDPVHRTAETNAA